MSLQLSGNIQDTHLKSMLDIVLESSQKQLTQLRTQLEDEPEVLVKKEREFIIRECSKLECIASLQIKLDEYRLANSKLKPKEKAKEVGLSSNSQKLGNHLRAIGQYRPNLNWQAHHIICSTHSSHAVARFKLFAYLGINDPFNGCWLPRKRKYATGTCTPNAAWHSYVHTNKYADWIKKEVRPASSKQDLINRLPLIHLKLHNAKDLPDIFTDKGKQDLRTPN